MRTTDEMRGTEIDWGRISASLKQAKVAMREALAPSPERAAQLLERAMLELVTFKLAGERYAIETRHVQEVVHFTGCTPVPGVPDVVAGVVSLRGEILAVFDIRPLLGLARADDTDGSRIIVCGASEPDLGILADTVHDVIRLPGSELRPHAICEDKTSGNLIRGITSDALIVLDGASLLSDQRLFVDRPRRQ